VRFLALGLIPDNRASSGSLEYARFSGFTDLPPFEAIYLRRSGDKAAKPLGFCSILFKPFRSNNPSPISAAY